MDRSRRNFLLKLGTALNAVAATLLAVPIIGYLGGALRGRREQAWIALGALDDFAVGQTRLATYVNPFTKPWDGDTAKIPCWVRRIAADQFQVFAINCTHLGCPVRWFPESELFMCPCHGGVYYADGERASGPPPRGLYQYDHKIDNGQLFVQGGRLPTLAQRV
ncbi:MAG: ubiquinol-cytochrome c reductase iron-sulfur subunit [Candidatus Binatia bacterium]